MTLVNSTEQNDRTFPSHHEDFQIPVTAKSNCISKKKKKKNSSFKGSNIDVKRPKQFHIAWPFTVGESTMECVHAD